MIKFVGESKASLSTGQKIDEDFHFIFLALFGKYPWIW